MASLNNPLPVVGPTFGINPGATAAILNREAPTGLVPSTTRVMFTSSSLQIILSRPGSMMGSRVKPTLRVPVPPPHPAAVGTTSTSPGVSPQTT